MNNNYIYDLEKKKTDYTYNLSNREHLEKAFSYIVRIRQLMSNGKKRFKWEPNDEELRNFLENLWVAGLKDIKEVLEMEVVCSIEERISFEEFVDTIQVAANKRGKNFKEIFAEPYYNSIRIYNFVNKPNKTYLNLIWYKMTRISEKFASNKRKEEKRTKEELIKIKKIENMRKVAEEYGFEIIEKKE